MEDMPERIETARLVVRCPRGADAAAVNAAVTESIDSLRPYLPWAQTLPSLAESEAQCRRLQALFLLRRDLPMFVFRREPTGEAGAFVGGTGLHRIDWAVRRFEIGYWCRTRDRGHGYMTEAVRAMTELAFDRLRARRVEIRFDPGNRASRAVAERAGFVLEGTLRDDSLTPQGASRDTCVYARVAADRASAAGTPAATLRVG